VSLLSSVVITEECNVLVISEKLIGATISDAIDKVSNKPMSL
jgi:hypothetical protein